MPNQYRHIRVFGTKSRTELYGATLINWSDCDFFIHKAQCAILHCAVCGERAGVLKRTSSSNHSFLKYVQNPRRCSWWRHFPCAPKHRSNNRERLQQRWVSNLLCEHDEARLVWRLRQDKRRRMNSSTHRNRLFVAFDAWPPEFRRARVVHPLTQDLMMNKPEWKCRSLATAPCNLTGVLSWRAPSRKKWCSLACCSNIAKHRTSRKRKEANTRIRMARELWQAYVAAKSVRRAENCGCNEQKNSSQS